MTESGRAAESPHQTESVRVDEPASARADASSEAPGGCLDGAVDAGAEKSYAPGGHGDETLDDVADGETFETQRERQCIDRGVWSSSMMHVSCAFVLLVGLPACKERAPSIARTTDAAPVAVWSNADRAVGIDSDFEQHEGGPGDYRTITLGEGGYAVHAHVPTDSRTEDTLELLFVVLDPSGKPATDGSQLFVLEGPERLRLEVAAAKEPGHYVLKRRFQAGTYTITLVLAGGRGPRVWFPFEVVPH